MERTTNRLLYVKVQYKGSLKHRFLCLEKHEGVKMMVFFGELSLKVMVKNLV